MWVALIVGIVLGYVSRKLKIVSDVFIQLGASVILGAYVMISDAGYFPKIPSLILVGIAGYMLGFWVPSFLRRLGVPFP